MFNHLKKYKLKKWMKQKLLYHLENKLEKNQQNILQIHHHKEILDLNNLVL